MNCNSANQLRELRWLLFWWLATVVAITTLGIGFAGSLGKAFDDNVIAWIFIASPAVPLALWLRARSRFRSGS